MGSTREGRTIAFDDSHYAAKKGLKNRTPIHEKKNEAVAN